jgi:hypothetical protein
MGGIGLGEAGFQNTKFFQPFLILRGLRSRKIRNFVSHIFKKCT